MHKNKFLLILIVVILGLGGFGLKYYLESVENARYKPSPELVAVFETVNTLGEKQDYTAAKKLLLEQKQKETDPRVQADIYIKLAMTMAIEAVNTRTESTLAPEARKILNPLLSQYQDPELFYTAGFVEEIAGELQIAINYYKAALELDSKNAKYLFQTGHAYELLGNIREAKNFYNQALAVNSDDTMVQIALAKTLWREGKREESIQKFKAFVNQIEDTRLQSEVLANLAILISQTSTKTEVLNEALEYAEKAIQVDSKFPLAFQAKAEVLLAQKENLDEAYTLLMNALALNPNQAVANLRLAEVQFLQNDYNAGLKNLLIFENKIEEDITIMPSDRLRWQKEAKVDRFLVLVGLRASLSQEPLHSNLALKDLDADVAVALRDVIEIGEDQEKVILMLNTINSNTIGNVLKDNPQWLAYTVDSFKPKLSDDNPFKDSVTIDMSISTNSLFTDQSESLIPDYAEKYFLRARLAHMFLNDRYELETLIQEVKISKSNADKSLEDEIEIYEALQPLQKTISTDEIKTVQDLIYKKIEENAKVGNAELYAIMADFQSKYGTQESALEYMQMASKFNLTNSRYLARLDDLNDNNQAKENVKLKLARHFLESDTEFSNSVLEFSKFNLSPEDKVLLDIYNEIESFYVNQSSAFASSQSIMQIRQNLDAIKINEIQNKIYAAIQLYPASPDLHALMADFLDLYTLDTENSVAYIKTSHELDSQNIRYLARTISLITDPAEQAIYRMQLPQHKDSQNQEEKLLYLSALDWTAEETKDELLVAESDFQSDDLKIAYYTLIVDYFIFNEDEANAEKFQNKNLSIYNPFQN